MMTGAREECTTGSTEEKKRYGRVVGFGAVLTEVEMGNGRAPYFPLVWVGPRHIIGVVEGSFHDVP